jgi:hypothetical protein
MAIQVIAVSPNQTIPPCLALGGLQIFSGILECLFKGDAQGGIARDTLSFTVGRVNLGSAAAPPVASCTVSLASFGYDGPGDPLWAVDSTQVTNFLNEDRGTGTADLQVVSNLAVRGANGFILRVNYVLFYFPA